MDLLVIDTATERGMFSYVRDDEVLFAYYLPFGLQEAQKLLAMLHEQLKQQGLSLQDLDAIAVGIGPGSYTGIRIGATIGKMLSYALSIPLVGVCTLETFAPESNENGEDNSAFAVAIDAKIAGIYVQLGETTGQTTTFSSPPQVLPLEEAVEYLKSTQTIVSPNVKPLQEKLIKHAQGHEWSWQELPPSPQQMAKAAQEKIHRGQATTKGDLELLYMRKTQAEIEADKKKGE